MQSSQRKLLLPSDGGDNIPPAKSRPKEEQVRSDQVLVHILDPGSNRAYCRFGPRNGDPAFWPPGHVYVTIGLAVVANCSACQAKLRQRQER